MISLYNKSYPSYYVMSISESGGGSERNQDFLSRDENQRSEEFSNRTDYTGGDRMEFLNV